MSIIAQFITNESLNTVILTSPFSLHFLKKFVDNIISAVPKDSVQTILFHFSNYNTNIQFMAEEETNNKIPQLIRHNQSIVLDRYIKPTNLYKYMNER